MKKNFITKIFIIFIFFMLFGCKSNLEQQFLKENENIKTEFKIETEKFIKQNSEKLSDEKMLYSLDSITEEYIINRNKNLAIKFIKTESGVKRLNFLKKNFSKEEIRTLIRKVPQSLQVDSNFVALKNYASVK